MSAAKAGPLPGPRRFPWAIYIVVAVVIAAFAFSPMLFVALAGVIANANGCPLDVLAPQPCLVNGVDWGGPLYAIAILGWFTLLTLPAGLVLAVVWLVALLLHRRRWRRAATAPTP